MSCDTVGPSSCLGGGPVYLRSPPDLHETSKLRTPLPDTIYPVNNARANLLLDHRKGFTMRKFVVTTVTAGALAAAALVLADAAAAFPGDGSAAHTAANVRGQR